MKKIKTVLFVIIPINQLKILEMTNTFLEKLKTDRLSPKNKGTWTLTGTERYLFIWKAIVYSFILSAFFWAPLKTYSQGLSKKGIKKEVKNGVKSLKKEGWELVGTPLTMEYVYGKYLTELESDPNLEPENGTIYCSNPDQCEMFVTAAARNKIAADAAGRIEGRIYNSSTLNADVKADQENVNKYLSAFRQKVSKYVTPEMLKKSFTVRRKPRVETEHNFEYQVYYVKNIEMLSKSVNRALEETKQEVEKIGEITGALDKIIDEGS